MSTGLPRRIDGSAYGPQGQASLLFLSAIVSGRGGCSRPPASLTEVITEPQRHIYVLLFRVLGASPETASFLHSEASGKGGDCGTGNRGANPALDCQRRLLAAGSRPRGTQDPPQQEPAFLQAVSLLLTASTIQASLFESQALPAMSGLGRAAFLTRCKHNI